MLPTERVEVGGHHHQISGTGHTQLLCVWQHPSNYKDSSSAAQKTLVSISLLTYPSKTFDAVGTFVDCKRTKFTNE